jgi:uncharacterized protein (DUF58 family)
MYRMGRMGWLMQRIRRVLPTWSDRRGASRASQSPSPRPQSPTHHSSLSTHHSFPGWAPAFQVAMERLSIAVRQPARGQHAGTVRSRARGRALEFADYRPYTPGDDPKLVDWRAYIRLDRLYLKQFEEERARRLTLLVDVSASLGSGDGEAHKGLYGRRLAAALAWIALSHHEPVRVSLLRDGGAAPLPPLSTRGAAVTLFRELEEVRESGGTLLSTSLRKALAGQTRGPVALITDLLDPTWPEALDALGSTGEGALLQLLSPEEWEPPLGEEVELEDAETGEVRPSRLGPVELATYRQRLEEFVSGVRRQCNRLGIVHVALNTGVPLQETVMRVLPRAGVLSG